MIMAKKSKKVEATREEFPMYSMGGEDPIDVLKWEELESSDRFYCALRFPDDQQQVNQPSYPSSKVSNMSE